MMTGRLPRSAAVLVLLALPAALPGPACALEQGVVTGEITRTNDRFPRDYEKLDYKGEKSWEAWGRGLASLGWVVVRRDAGKSREELLLVIDTRTAVAGAGSQQGRFPDLRAGDRIRAKYRMGWDALHALDVRKLNK